MLYEYTFLVLVLPTAAALVGQHLTPGELFADNRIFGVLGQKLGRLPFEFGSHGK